MNSPCMECKRRSLGCHNVNTCKPWAEYQERVRMANERRQKDKTDCENYVLHTMRHGEKRREL